MLAKQVCLASQAVHVAGAREELSTPESGLLLWGLRREKSAHPARNVGVVASNTKSDACGGCPSPAQFRRHGMHANTHLSIQSGQDLFRDRVNSIAIAMGRLMQTNGWMGHLLSLPRTRLFGLYLAALDTNNVEMAE